MDENDELVEELTVVEGGPLLAPPRPLSAGYVRDLTEADLAALDQPRPNMPVSGLARIHSSHHALAKCLAAGMRPAQAALVTGYSGSRISVLQRDPLFAELVNDYKGEHESVMADLAVRMRGLSLDVIEIIHERLHSNPEAFSPTMLLDLLKAMADRTGHGTNSNVNLNVNLPTIDRPPRENYDDWKARRLRELDPLALEPPTRTPN